MRALVGVSLLLVSNSFLEIYAAEGSRVVEESTKSSGPTKRRHLSVQEVTSVLTTEAHTEYGTHRLLKEVSNELWSTSMDYEWSRARDLESAAQTNAGALRRTTATEGTFPYLVCDTEPGKSGESCRATLTSHFGTALLPVSNQLDRTCYITSVLASIADSAPESLVVSPMLPEMKLEQGIVDAIVFQPLMPKKFQSMFCPGEASSSEESMLLVEDVLSRVEEQEGASGRRLAANFFTRSDVKRETTDYERSAFRNRTLQDQIDSDLCQDIFGGIDTNIAEKGGSFSFESSVQSTQEDVRRCLLLLVTGLAAQPEICWIGVVPGMIPLNSEAQWISQSRQSNSRPFFDVGLTGSGQVIGVSDTGLDIDNCYFWDASGEELAKDGSVDMTRRKVVQYVSLGDDSDETKGHGTHVAGTAAGQRASDGISESPGEVDGIAPGAKLSFVDLGVAGQDTLNIPFPPSSIYEHGLQAGSKIHSSSWGIGYNHYGAGERDLDTFMVDNPDVLIVLAAGNSGDTPNAVGSPATCKNALSVGASQNAVSHTRAGMLGEEYLAWFSSAGPTHDGRMKPEVIAPGYYIRSAESRPDKAGECDEQDSDGVDGLMYSAGTSMAAPIVAGTAALIRQYFEEGWYPSGAQVSADSLQPSSSLVKAVLINGAQPLVGRQQKDLDVSLSNEYDVHQGFGAITLINSLPLAGKNQLQSKVVDRKVIWNGEEDVYAVTIDNSNGCSAPLSATLVWADPPGVPNCAACLLNNLDLDVVKAGQSTTYYPNGRTDPDTVNNAERIRISEPSDGSVYIVRVKGTNLDSSSQDYSLIITGCLGEAVSNEKTTKQAQQTQQQACTNQDGTVLMDDEVGMETCGWLEGNKADYQYLCAFTDVATTCPETCGFCPAAGKETSTLAPKSVATAMNGTVEWYGCMFDVAAKNNATIKSLSFRTPSTESVNVAVYTKRGTYTDGSEQLPEAWTLIAQTVVKGQGVGNLTTIPGSAFQDVKIQNGALQAFYVTTGDSKNIILSGGSQFTLQLDDTWSENSDLSLLTGKATTGSFGGSYSPYAWNGKIHYTVELGCVDKNDLITVDNNVGAQSCDWLSKNQGRFGYLCDRVAVATTCPVTCSFCDSIAK